MVWFRLTAADVSSKWRRKKKATSGHKSLSSCNCISPWWPDGRSIVSLGPARDYSSLNCTARFFKSLKMNLKKKFSPYRDRRSFQTSCGHGSNPLWDNSIDDSWTDVCIRKWPVWRLLQRPQRHPDDHAPIVSACGVAWRARPDPNRNWWLSSPWWNWTLDYWVHRHGQFP